MKFAMDPIDILFTYRNNQGDFIIRYGNDGIGRVYLCANPDVLICARTSDDIRSKFNLATRQYPSIQVWSHNQDVARDRQHYSEAQIIEIYRSLFLEDQISRTFLESPEQDKLPRLKFPLKLKNGEMVQIVLRADQVGYLCRNVPWAAEHGRGTTNYTNQYPFPMFHHALTPDQINKHKDIIQGKDGHASALKEMYAVLFWDHINPYLSHRWIRSQDEVTNKPPQLDHCSLDEFTALMTAIGHIDTVADNSIEIPLYLNVRTGYESRAGLVIRSDGFNQMFSDKAMSLLKLLVAWANPRGSRIESNGGDENNWSGYHQDTILIKANVPPPTATQRMEALEMLHLWSERTGIPIDDYLPQ